MPRIAAILLAAGASLRFGPENKLLASVRGEPLIDHSLRMIAALDFCDRLVVTGHDASRIEERAEKFGVGAVRNPRHGEGMGSSLAAGAALLPAEIDGVAIFLGDMPDIETSTVELLLSRFTDAACKICVRPVYHQTHGHPVIFPTAAIAKFSGLKNDVGAKALIGSSAKDLLLVEVDDPGVVRDYDRKTSFDVE